MMESVEIRVYGSDGIYEVECHFGKFHSSRPCRTVGDILEAVFDSMAAYRRHAKPKLSDEKRLAEQLAELLADPPKETE